MKKHVLVFLFIFAAAVAAYIPFSDREGASGTDGSKTQQSVSFALNGVPGDIDPGTTSESYAYPLLNNAFEGLVTYDPHNSIIPGLAESWEISRDGLTYTFHLRPNLKWSDGSSLTANDFLYSWLRVITPETKSLYANQLLPYVVNAQEFHDGRVPADKVGIRAADDNTLIVKLVSPTPHFLRLLASYTFYPVKRTAVEAKGEGWTDSAKTYVSNGPFRVISINRGKSYELEKNEHYWNAANVKLERLKLVFFPDSTAALEAFRAKKTDGLWEVPANELASPGTENNDELITVNSFGTTFHIFNLKRAPFNNPLVRKAFNLAVDRDTLTRKVLGINDKLAYSLISPGYLLEGKDITYGRSTYEMGPNAYPAEARKLLAEAGYPNGEGFPEVIYYHSQNDTYKKTVEAIADMLKTNLNISVKLKSAPWAEFYRDIRNGDFQLAQFGWGGEYLHPMAFLNLMVTNSSSNYTGYSNPSYDRLVADIAKTSDSRKATVLIRRAEDLMMKDYPVMPLFFRSYSYMMRKNIVGYFRTPLNNLYFRDAFVKQ